MAALEKFAQILIRLATWTEHKNGWLPAQIWSVGAAE